MLFVKAIVVMQKVYSLYMKFTELSYFTEKKKVNE